MWWYVKKIKDDASIVSYSYGFETKEQSGTVHFDKMTEEFSVEGIADGDNRLILERFLLHHLHRLITCAGCPDEKIIAIG